MTEWMDERPYPGPEVELSLNDLIKSVSLQLTFVGEQYCKMYKQLGVIFEKISGIEDSKPNPIPSDKPKLSNLNKNGPRNGPAYDHRGRRKW